MSNTAEPNTRHLDFIRNEMCCIRREWCVFRRLAVIGENDGGIVTRIVPEFYGFVHLALFRDAMMALNRLFDNKRGVVSLRSTLNSQRNNIRNHEFEVLAARLDDLVELFSDARLKVGRDQVGAHNDQSIALLIEDAPSSSLAVVGQLIGELSQWIAEVHTTLGHQCRFDETRVEREMDRLSEACHLFLEQRLVSDA